MWPRRVKSLPEGGDYSNEMVALIKRRPSVFVRTATFALFLIFPVVLFLLWTISFPRKVDTTFKMDRTAEIWNSKCTSYRVHGVGDPALTKAAVKFDSLVLGMKESVGILSTQFAHDSSLTVRQAQLFRILDALNSKYSSQKSNLEVLSEDRIGNSQRQESFKTERRSIKSDEYIQGHIVLKSSVLYLAEGQNIPIVSKKISNDQRFKLAGKVSRIEAANKSSTNVNVYLSFPIRDIDCKLLYELISNDSIEVSVEIPSRPLFYSVLISNTL